MKERDGQTDGQTDKQTVCLRKRERIRGTREQKELDGSRSQAHRIEIR